MTGRLSLPAVVMVAVAAALGAAGAACGLPVDVPQSTGSVDIGFIDVGDLSLDDLDYTISGNGLAPIQGSISLADANATATALVGGIPPGSQYLLELRGTSQDGAGQCYGAAAFDVSAGQSSTVMITLVCSYPTKVHTIEVNGMTDYCPSLSSYAAAPMTGFVGGPPLSVTATSFSYYSDPPLFMWQASAGVLSSPGASVSSLTCTTPGPVTLTVTVTDGYCPDTATLVVTCLPAPPGDAGADAGAAADGARLQDGGML